MSRHPIIGRRPCDNEISESYGGRGAATHSPSAERPGTISDDLRAEFEDVGYRLCTSLPARGLIEVYPHPALIEFMNETRSARVQSREDADLLAETIHPEAPGRSSARSGRASSRTWTAASRARGGLPPPSPDVRGWRLKAYEDKLDAVVCATVAVAALDGKAQPYGDEDAAIWVPLGEPRQ